MHRHTQNVARLVAGLLALFIASSHAAESKAPAGTAKATFAGGCFWCMEPPYDELPGVISTTSGYAGGHKKNPTYQEVSAGGTDHAEVVQVVYDPTKISYEKLLEVYWRNIDPYDPLGQFCDKGDQYRAEIFYHDESQKRLAEASKAAIEKQLRNPTVVRINAVGTFYPAEDYHQDYYKRNPIRYKFYRNNCGRDKRLEKIWGKAPH
jgi:peptide-methionine (S)-S-oxide reductase